MVMGYGCAKSGCWQYEAILPSAPAENPAAGILVNATVYYTTFIAVICGAMVERRLEGHRRNLQKPKP